MHICMSCVCVWGGGRNDPIGVSVTDAEESPRTPNKAPGSASSRSSAAPTCKRHVRIMSEVGLLSLSSVSGLRRWGGGASALGTPAALSYPVTQLLSYFPIYGVNLRAGGASLSKLSS